MNQNQKLRMRPSPEKNMHRAEAGMTHKAASYLLRNSKILYIYVLKQLENELQQLRHLTRVRWRMLALRTLKY